MCTLPALQTPSLPVQLAPHNPAFGGNHVLAFLYGMTSSVCEQHGLAGPEFDYTSGISTVGSYITEVPPAHFQSSPPPVSFCDCGSFTFVAV